MATHKDDKKSDNVAKKKRLNASVISKAERVQMEKSSSFFCNINFFTDSIYRNICFIIYFWAKDR